MDAVMVKERDGYYQMTDAEVEDWYEVKRLCQVERIDALVGWGRWTASYRVTDEHGQEYVYFVDERAC